MWHASSHWYARHATTVMSHMSHVTYESCHRWMSYMTYSHITWATCILQIWKRRDAFLRGNTHSYMTWLIQILRDSFMCDMTPSYNLLYAGHSCLTRLFMRDMTNSYVTWLIHMSHDSFICATTPSYAKWLIHMWHDSFKRNTTHEYVMWLIAHLTEQTLYVARMNNSYYTWVNFYVARMNKSHYTWVNLFIRAT